MRLLFSCILLLIVAGCGNEAALSGGNSLSGGNQQLVQSVLAPTQPTQWPFQAQLSPSTVDRLLSVGDGVTVMLPKDLIQQPRTLTVTPVAKPHPHNLPFLTIRTAYSVDLGDLHDLGDQEIVVCIPYTLVGSEDPTVTYFGAYYDETLGDWVTLPTSIDTVNHRLYIHTHHLSDIAFGTVLDTFGKYSFIQNDQFVMLYDKVEAEKEAVGYTSDPDKDVPKLANTHPYISDAWYALTRAYTIYRNPQNNFKDLLWGKTLEIRFEVNSQPSQFETVWLRQKVYVEGNNYPYQSHVTGNIVLSYLSSIYGYEDNERNAAHELFHAFQARSYAALTMSVSGNWWMEATAEMAQGRLVFPERNPFDGRTPKMGGSKPSDDRFWLQRPINFFYGKAATIVVDEKYSDHQYATSLFLAYLADIKGVNFVDLYKKQAEYYTGTFLSNLEYYLKTTKNLSLDTAYQHYSEFFVFDPKSPVRQHLLGDGLLQLAENTDKTTPMAVSNTKRSWEITLDDYRAMLVRIPIDGSTPRTLKLKLNSPDSWNSVTAYATNGGQLDSSPQRLGSLSADAPELSFESKPGDVVYFLVSAGHSPLGLTAPILVDISDETVTGEAIEIWRTDFPAGFWFTQSPGGPPDPTTFTLDGTYKITRIANTHGPATSWGDVGSIGLQGIGDWVSTVRHTWNTLECAPNIILGPGSYTVTDSDPATWMYIRTTGFTVIEGIKL